jgi:hypothetical protein
MKKVGGFTIVAHLPILRSDLSLYCVISPLFYFQFLLFYCSYYLYVDPEGIYSRSYVDGFVA